MGETPTVPIDDRLREQAQWCRVLGSPLYGELLDRAAVDFAAGGPTADLLSGHEDDPPGSMLALRFMGAVHRIALEGRAPELAEHYPSAGGETGLRGAWEALRAVLRDHANEIGTLMERPVQTNEVGRAGALVGGFLLVARAAGLPLRILEIGASAGLNLRWDHFRYEARGETWGPPGSPVRLCDFNSEKRLPFDIEASVVERAGCDARPVDATTEDGRLTLMAYVWPDQVHRFRLLRAAFEVARAVPATLQTARAADWLERTAAPRDGVATIVFHSIVMQYLPADEVERAETALLAAAGAATESAPFAWLRMEPAGDVAEVRLNLWPGDGERVVATAGYHGQAVRWLGESELRRE